MTSLKGKTLFVSGGSRGIGKPSRMFSVSSNTVPPEDGSGIDTMS